MSRTGPNPSSTSLAIARGATTARVDAGERFQVKRITVKPGAKLSLQKHYHRAEHWVVVHGTAIVQRGEERMLVRENESVYIPIGTEHRLENPGKLPLQLIEVQSGPYLGEDDIVRDVRQLRPGLTPIRYPRCPGLVTPKKPRRALSGEGSLFSPRPPGRRGDRHLFPGVMTCRQFHQQSPSCVVAAC